MLILIGFVLILIGFRRRATAPVQPQVTAPVAAYDFGTGIHPAAYAAGGWLEGTTSPVTQTPPAPFATAASDPFYAPGPGAAPIAPPVAFGPPGPSTKKQGKPGTAWLIVGLVLVGLGALSLAENLATNIMRGPVHSAAIPTVLVGFPQLRDATVQAQLDKATAASPTHSLEAAAYSSPAMPAYLVLLLSPLGSGDADSALYFTGFERGLFGDGHAAPTPTTVDPGALGGAAKCWPMEAQGSVACTWIVQGLAGAVIVRSTDVASVASTMRDVRSQIEKTG